MFTYEHIYSMLFKFRASQQWNNLPVSVARANSLSGFKTTISEHFLVRGYSSLFHIIRLFHAYCKLICILS